MKLSILFYAMYAPGNFFASRKNRKTTSETASYVTIQFHSIKSWPRCAREARPLTKRCISDRVPTGDNWRKVGDPRGPQTVTFVFWWFLIENTIEENKELIIILSGRHRFKSFFEENTIINGKNLFFKIVNEYNAHFNTNHSVQELLDEESNKRKHLELELEKVTKLAQELKVKLENANNKLKQI